MPKTHMPKTRMPKDHSAPDWATKGEVIGYTSVCDLTGADNPLAMMNRIGGFNVDEMARQYIEKGIPPHVARRAVQALPSVYYAQGAHATVEHISRGNVGWEGSLERVYLFFGNVPAHEYENRLRKKKSSARHEAARYLAKTYSSFLHLLTNVDPECRTLAKNAKTPGRGPLVEVWKENKEVKSHPSRNRFRPARRPRQQEALHRLATGQWMNVMLAGAIAQDRRIK